MIQLNDKQYHCNIEVIVDVIGGKWKMLILWNLKEDLKRFNELRRLHSGITQKMLTANSANSSERNRFKKSLSASPPEGGILVDEIRPEPETVY